MPCCQTVHRGKIKKSQEDDVSIASNMDQRGHWSNQWEFFLSCIGYSVGLSSIWRFPYLCMRNGGGAFLIPFYVSLFLCGMPLMCLELVIGQFSGFSPVLIWEVCPLFKGLGYGMVILSAIVATYYNVILCWTVYYLIKSFTLYLPWSECSPTWSTPLCLATGVIDSESGMLTPVEWNRTMCNNTTTCGKLYDDMNGSNMIAEARKYANVADNASIPWRSPAEEFWEHSVLELTDGIEDLGGVKWDMFGTLFLSWIIVFLCLCKGIKSSGKVVYVTATAPFFLLTILLIRGVLLPGAVDGIKYYLIPDWSKLLQFQVWAEAMLQVFYSLGPAWGGLTTMASYNKFHQNCIRDGIFIPIVASLTSFYGGFVIFSVIGYMAHEANLPVKDVVTSGPGLAFIVYPQAIGTMPLSPLWAICFFVMLITVGLDSQFGMFETMMSSIVDKYPRYLRRYKVLFTALMSTLMFLCGIPLVTRGGMYIFQIVDWFVATSVVAIGLFEVCSLAWFYGYDRLYYDIEMMTGKRPGPFWKICWCVINPVILTIIMVYSFVGLKTPTYGNYEYPWWALLIGWFIALASILPLPIAGVHSVLQQNGSLLQRVRLSLKPSEHWVPADKESLEKYRYSRNLSVVRILLKHKHTTNSKPTVV